jgi:NAD(P)-dependent dehydrogenase (short-subunit alcohol dehydrogenase family)
MEHVIVITGTTSGLGKFIFDKLSKSPTKVIPIDKSTFNLATFKGVEKAMVLMEDLQWKNRTNPCKLFLINNAGVFFDDYNGSVKKMTDMVHVNLMAPYYLTQSAIECGFELVINIASVSGIKGEEDAALYAATKAGLINMTKSFARLGKTKTRVNSISPGFIRDTNLVPGGDDSVFPDKGEFGYPDILIKDNIFDVIQLLRFNESINGANIVIDGGYLIP